jgi:prolipoprotein diacylglyceryl transferase
MTQTVLAYLPSPSQGVWHLGPLPIRAYTLLVIAGIVVAARIGERRWVDRGGAPGAVYDVALWAIPFGLIGGRLYHVATDWRTYFGTGGAGFGATLRVWAGGLGIWGVIAMGGVGAWIACRRRGVSTAGVADAVAPGIALAQAIGRIGNYFNQEFFGRATDLPWGLAIFSREDSAGFVDVHAVNGVSTGEVALVVHPIFLYELLWDVIVFVFLIKLDRRVRLAPGVLFVCYLASYAFGRFCVLLLRGDGVAEGAIGTDTVVSLFVFLVATTYLVINRGTLRILRSPEAVGRGTRSAAAHTVRPVEAVAAAAVEETAEQRVAAAVAHAKNAQQVARDAESELAARMARAAKAKQILAETTAVITTSAAALVHAREGARDALAHAETELTGRLEAMQAAVRARDDAEARLATCDSEAALLADVVTYAAAAGAVAEAARFAAESAHSDALERVATARESLAANITALETADAAVADAETGVEAAKQKLRDAEAAIAEAAAEVEAAERSYRDAEATIPEAAARVEAAKRAARDAAAEADKAVAAAELETARRAVEEAEAAAAACAAVTDAARRSLVEAQAAAVEVAADAAEIIAAATKRADDAKAAVEKAKLAVKQAAADLAARTAQVKSVRRALEELDAARVPDGGGDEPESGGDAVSAASARSAQQIDVAGCEVQEAETDAAACAAEAQALMEVVRRAAEAGPTAAKARGAAEVAHREAEERLAQARERVEAARNALRGAAKCDQGESASAAPPRTSDAETLLGAGVGG